MNAKNPLQCVSAMVTGNWGYLHGELTIESVSQATVARDGVAEVLDVE